MKHALRYVMILLSYIPSASVVAAVSSKSSELEGEIQSTKLKQAIQGARFRILPPYSLGSSLEDARKRYAEITGLAGEELELNLADDLWKLSEHGLIEFDEKKIKALGPSEHASY